MDVDAIYERYMVLGLNVWLCVIVNTLTWLAYQIVFFYVLPTRFGVTGIVNTLTRLMCSVSQSCSKVTVNTVNTV